MEKEPEFGKTLVFSYLALRKVIGLLGVALPFTLIIGALIFFKTGIQGSISSYYYTGMRDIFVGTLWAIGFFLLSYQGYGRIDNIFGNFACVFAVGVALFPTAPDIDPSITATWIGRIHLIFAASFFFTLMCFSLFLFTKTNPTQQPTPEKLQRNRVYKACGYTLAVCIVLIAMYAFLPNKELSPLTAYHPVFWLETIAILAFGVSWLTKGEAILKDEFSSSSNPALSPSNV
jgi:hypothetical protein